MPCYNSIDGEPASVSHRLLTELLRERMGFDGLCISDYGGISNAHEVQRIGETIGETGFLAMEAGMDMEMPKAIGYGEKLKEMFRSGQADTELLDRTVLRVLEAKFRMGLFEQPFAMDGESCKKIFEEKEGAELSLRSARESMVLLKNNGVLPLSGKIKKLALIGPHADCARKFFVHDGVGLRGRKFYRRGRGQPGVRTDRRGNAARRRTGELCPGYKDPVR